MKNLRSIPVHLRTSGADANGIPALQHQQRAIERLLRVAAAVAKLAPQRRQARAPAEGQPALQLVLDLGHLLHHFLASLTLALGHGIHGRGQEETDGLVHVCFRGNGRQAQLRQGLGDTDDGFQLTHRDGDRRPRVGVELCAVDLLADGDEMRRELLCSFGR